MKLLLFISILAFSILPIGALAHEGVNIRVEDHYEEAKKLSHGVHGAINETNLKASITYFGQRPKEQDYREGDLTSKANSYLSESVNKAENPNLSAEERAEAEGAATLKESFGKRKKFDKLAEEKWLQKSEEISNNPLIGLGADCKVSGKADERVELKAESYEVEVDDIREVENEETCEEEGIEVHKCVSVLHLSCESMASKDDTFVISRLEEYAIYNALTTLNYNKNPLTNYIITDLSSTVHSLSFNLRDKKKLKSFALVMTWKKPRTYFTRYRGEWNEHKPADRDYAWYSITVNGNVIRISYLKDSQAVKDCQSKGSVE